MRTPGLGLAAAPNPEQPAPGGRRRESEYDPPEESLRPADGLPRYDLIKFACDLPMQVHGARAQYPGACAAFDAVALIAHARDVSILESRRQIRRRCAGEGQMRKLLRVMDRLAGQNEPERPATVAPALGRPAELNDRQRAHRRHNAGGEWRATASRRCALSTAS